MLCSLNPRALLKKPGWAGMGQVTWPFLGLGFDCSSLPAPLVSSAGSLGVAGRRRRSAAQEQLAQPLTVSHASRPMFDLAVILQTTGGWWLPQSRRPLNPPPPPPPGLLPPSPPSISSSAGFLTPGNPSPPNPVDVVRRKKNNTLGSTCSNQRHVFRDEFALTRLTPKIRAAPPR